MDPNEALAAFLEAVRDADKAYDRYAKQSDQATAWEHAARHAIDLIEWLAAGGFAPNWKQQWERHQIASWHNDEHINGTEE